MSLSPGSYPRARRSLTVYSRRAVLNIAMLPRDGVRRIEQRLQLHHARLRRLEAPRVEPTE
ncbi:hypothetical protein [Streptomyces sp. NPDC048410]|uniref:hypothetical protein n=1 Tax=Streptomyces sp. NPDC048410 TaxID=3365545 RepID=UPI003718CA64